MTIKIRGALFKPCGAKCFYSYVLQLIFYSSPLKAIGMKFCIKLSHIQDYILIEVLYYLSFQLQNK